MKQIKVISDSYKDYHIPTIDNSIGHGVIRYYDQIVGFGIVKLRPDCFIFLNNEVDKKLRTAGLLRLFSEAKAVAMNHGYDELVAATTNEQYAELLIKHLKFKHDPGKLLRLEL